MPNTRQQGTDWERVAESLLKQRGLKTVKRNFQGRSGEIDMVMIDGGTLVFVEVRYRANRSHGSGAESVTRTKQERIVNTARLFLQRHPCYRRSPCRFDVVSIGTEGGKTVMEWIPAAFDAG